MNKDMAGCGGKTKTVRFVSSHVELQEKLPAGKVMEIKESYL